MLFHLLPGGELAQVLERLGYRVAREQLGRPLAYYLVRTRHDSSLSRIVHAGALARFDPAASWRLFQEALERDANPMNSGHAEEGLHLGAMAGVLDVPQRHYLGLRPTRAAIRFDPAPPPELGPVGLDFRYRQGDFWLEWDGSRLRIAAAATNRESVSVCCGGRTESLKPGAALAFDPPEAAGG
jgi:trehalose/maltose hydrolase-like predicted phosphorylase